MTSHRIIKQWYLPIAELILFLMLAFPSHAQDTYTPDAHGMNKIQTLKIAYLTEKMNLTPEEAKNFWPLYDQYQIEIRNLIKARRDHSLDGTSLSAATDQQVQEALRNDYEYQKKALDLRYAYEQKFLHILSARKVFILYQAEKSFNIQLIKELKLRRQMNRKRPVP